jgi:hypothetical protein
LLNVYGDQKVDVSTVRWWVVRFRGGDSDVRIFAPERDEVTGRRRKLLNEELRDLYTLPSINRIIRPRRMRWARHVARTGEKMNAYSYWWESQRKGDH